MSKIKHEIKDSYRLNKYISDQGYCSRREADRLILKGLVFVNGKIAEIGMQVNDDDIIKINNKVLRIKKSRVYLMLNKPKGIISTTDTNIKGNIRDFVNYDELIFPIGRLDKDSTGLILLTNDGDIVNKILRVEYGHEKEYLVKVNKKINKSFINNMEKGVLIFNPVRNRNEVTLPAKIKQVDNKTFKIIIKQGLNRQIRRMTQALGYNVVDLKRIRIMDITLGDLKEGSYRLLTDKELINLNKRINISLI